MYHRGNRVCKRLREGAPPCIRKCKHSPQADLQYSGQPIHGNTRLEGACMYNITRSNILCNSTKTIDLRVASLWQGLQHTAGHGSWHTFKRCLLWHNSRQERKTQCSPADSLNPPCTCHTRAQICMLQGVCNNCTVTEARFVQAEQALLQMTMSCRAAICCSNPFQA